jgi:hypothetical protein
MFSHPFVVASFPTHAVMAGFAAALYFLSGLIGELKPDLAE